MDVVKVLDPRYFIGSLILIGLGLLFLQGVL